MMAPVLVPATQQALDFTQDLERHDAADPAAVEREQFVRRGFIELVGDGHVGLLPERFGISVS